MTSLEKTRLELALFTAMLSGGMILLIVWTPAFLAFGMAAAVASWWCWWLDGHPER